MKNFSSLIMKVNKFSRFERLLLLAPLAIWFSYYPNFHLGRTDGMNVEFSILMIYILVLALAALPGIWRAHDELLHRPSVWLTGAFVDLNILSIFWSDNTIRAILTSGVWLVLWLIFVRLLVIKKSQIWPILKKLYIYSAVFMSGLAILQVVYGTWVDWGLCAGCLARGFGFVRPSVWTIEPQFFASLLLVPILLLFKKSLQKRSSRAEFWQLFVMLVAIYLTLSRGAIFALLVVISALLIWQIGAKLVSFKTGFLVSIAIICGSFATGAVIHGVFTQLNPRVSDGFYDSISKSVSQMTLGVVEIPDAIIGGRSENILSPEAMPGDEIDIEIVEEPSDSLDQKTSTDRALFDGYVERSTDERTNMSTWALETWRRDVPTMIFGVGTGGAGRAIYEHTGQTGWEFEIVQNQFLELLLENGLIGLALFITILLGFMIATRRRKIAWVILLAFIVQWNFFSGLPNALHIYLILAIIFATIVGAYEKEFQVGRWLRATK